MACAAAAIDERVRLFRLFGVHEHWSGVRRTCRTGSGAPVTALQLDEHELRRNAVLGCHYLSS